MALTPKQIFDLITNEGVKALSENWSRFGVEWGGFSVSINREIRKRIEADDPEKAKLKLVFVYWTLWSEAVERAFHLKAGKKINHRYFDAITKQIENTKLNVDTGVWKMGGSE